MISGSLALVKGKNPLRVNVSGWITHQPNGDPGESAVYDDSMRERRFHSFPSAIVRLHNGLSKNKCDAERPIG